MKTFRAYRDITKMLDTHSAHQLTPSHDPQFEGVVFDDGKCVIHWLTSVHSIAVFDTFDQMLTIHGHPEYGSRIVFDTEEVSDEDQTAG